MGIKLWFPRGLDVPHDSRVQMQASGQLRAAVPGRRLYERLLGRRLKLLVTHWPPTPRSGARADATTVPATATAPEWRSRPCAYYQLEMWR